MNITEFAKSRNIKPQTVSRYINRHSEKFDGLVLKSGKEITLSEEAIYILDKVYPLPKPIQVIVDHESRDKLVEAQSIIIKLQQQLNNQAEQIAGSRINQILLEQKEQELETIKSDLQTEKEKTAAAIAEVQEIKIEANKRMKESWDVTENAINERDAAYNEIQRLQAELSAMKSEVGSYKKSIFGFYRKSVWQIMKFRKLSSGP